MPSAVAVFTTPACSHRFAIAHVVLIADIDVIAGLDHLLCGLREISLVAIDRRNLKNTGQEAKQTNKKQHRGGSTV